MSRFDLFFVVLDECDDTVDYRIARQIVESRKDPHGASMAHFSTSQIAQYVRYARTINPKVCSLLYRQAVS